jgi:DNA-binding XRE family transcriptional regulator
MRVKLKQVRERLFVTQAELAQRTGITEATISRIENGQHQPRISTVRKIAEGLGLRPEDLVDWNSATDEDPEMGKAAA